MTAKNDFIALWIRVTIEILGSLFYISFQIIITSMTNNFSYSLVCLVEYRTDIMQEKSQFKKL